MFYGQRIWSRRTARHRGPPSDTCCPLRGLPSTHATLHLASMTGVLGEEEEARRRAAGCKGIGKEWKKDVGSKRREGGEMTRDIIKTEIGESEEAIQRERRQWQREISERGV